MIKTIIRKYTSRIINPNSMIFEHKKELDSIQKKLTKMDFPETSKNNQLSPEDDFEPGLNYFFNGFPYSIKICENFHKEGIADPREGWVTLIVPFDKSIKLKQSLELLDTGRVRYGKLMELFDYLSALSCCRFNAIRPRDHNATIVTASVDSIMLYKDIDMNLPLVITAYPTFTGDSSLEIRIDLYNDEAGSNFLGSAFFVYALRSAKDYKIKMKTKQLIYDNFEGDEKKKAMLRFEIGKESQALRIREHKIESSPPNQVESEILHSQYLIFKKLKEENKKFICTNMTKKEMFLLMQSQDRNINGHIFGGYIMNQALQLGYVCAHMHCKAKLKVLCVDSVNFYKPVIVGSVAQFIAEVHFVYQELIHVSVEVYDYIGDQKILTTTINVIYKSETPAEEVIPNSYECGLKYLMAKRRISKLFENI
jgi:acyl-CoA hydrolase